MSKELLDTDKFGVYDTPEGLELVVLNANKRGDTALLNELEALRLAVVVGGRQHRLIA